MISILLKNIGFRCSKLKVPIVDVQPFLTQTGNYTQDCKVVADALHKYGCLIIKDPRVNQHQNDTFINMMEKYFAKRSHQFYQGKQVAQILPQFSYQVGATPQYIQKAKQHKNITDQYINGNKADTTFPPPFDAKWRYFWNIGDAVGADPNQSPKDFPQWQKNMNSWGNHMINGCNVVAEMAAIGLGLQRNIFTKMLNGGPHKLAPTGSDLVRYKVGTVFAGFHYDFNFLTIHGKARYPGLFAWLRTGQKFTVSVPEGHLLLQAGKQFEWLTGGYINCGYHEVIYTKAVQQAKDKAVKQGRIPWRVSSTLFSHVTYDTILQPLDKYKTQESSKKYPKIGSKEHTMQELQDISLKR